MSLEHLVFRSDQEALCRDLIEEPQRGHSAGEDGIVEMQRSVER